MLALWVLQENSWTLISGISHSWLYKLITFKGKSKSIFESAFWGFLFLFFSPQIYRNTNPCSNLAEGITCPPRVPLAGKFCLFKNVILLSPFVAAISRLCCCSSKATIRRAPPPKRPKCEIDLGCGETWPVCHLDWPRGVKDGNLNLISYVSARNHW